MRPFSDDRREALRTRVQGLAPRLPKRGKEGADVRAVAAVLAEAGLFALGVPAAHGGAAATVESLSLVVAREEVSFLSGIADAVLAVQGLTAYPLGHAGSDAVKSEWLPRLARGQAIGAFAATEPEAGSDLAAATSTARRDGSDYVIDGHKVFISNAGLADVYVVLARTGAAGLSAFAVPASSSGIDVTPMELLASHPVGSVRLRGVRVPEQARLGAEGDGLGLCLGALEVFRPTVGAAACGLARRALDETQKRVSVRQQFGKPLAQQQSVQFTLADMATDLEAARLLVYRAAWLRDQGDGSSRASSMAKLFATEAAQRIVDQAVQLHGAAGLVRGGTVESLYREVRAMRIYEGTSEIQKLVIARELLTPARAPASGR